MTDTNNFNLISIKEFAKRLGKSESTIRTWRRRGHIPEECFFEIAGTVYVKVERFAQLSA